jgi:glycosyltransferase involved in cell wall biosynthesis
VTGKERGSSSGIVRGDSVRGFPQQLATVPRRWLILAASGRPAADAYATACGIEAQLVLEKHDLLVSPRRLRRLARDNDIDGLFVHSTSWSRQRSPQVFELALALIPVRQRFIVDDERGLVHRVGPLRLTSGLARIPVDTVRDAVVIAAEAGRMSLRRARRSPVETGHAGDEPSVIAVWPGSLAAFGGSLTHIEGILGGFRRHGFRVGLLTREPIPERLQAVIDDFELAPPLSQAARLTWDTEQLGANASLRRAGAALARRMNPTLVYQRHSPFLVAGADLAESLLIPFVLEWNGSEAWIRRNWLAESGLAHSRANRLLDPLLTAMERNVVSRATLVSAVSREAAEMAFEAGAGPSKTIVVPNAVDVTKVDAALRGASIGRDDSGALLGWAGSFGPWHGAEIAVRALSKLPTDVRLRMIGDGNERRACEETAEALGVADRIEMTGPLTRDQTLQRLVECDVLLSPHTPLRDQPFFGSPTKIFEYMALGKPIVVSRLGQLGELFEDGITARLVTPGDVDEVADAVMTILQSPDHGRALGEAARRVAKRDHTWDDRARALLERLGVPAKSQRVVESAEPA